MADSEPRTGDLGFAKGRLGTLQARQRFFTGRRSRRQGSETPCGNEGTFSRGGKENKDLPIGAGIWLRIHPEDRVKTSYTSWTFDGTTTRLPEFAAPGIGRESNKVTIRAEIGENTSGVLYALGGAGGGVTLYMDSGQLVYEYNMMIIERTILRSKGRHTERQTYH